MRQYNDYFLYLLINYFLKIKFNILSNFLILLISAIRSSPLIISSFKITFQKKNNINCWWYQKYQHRKTRIIFKCIQSGKFYYQDIKSICKNIKHFHCNIFIDWEDLLL